MSAKPKQIPEEEANQLYGRMMECCDIEIAIESGQFASLQDVLVVVKLRSRSINQQLKADGRMVARIVSAEEFALAEAQHEAKLIHKTRH